MKNKIKFTNSKLSPAIILDVKENITFVVKGEEMLKLTADNNIYVQGRLAENDKEVVEAMRNWLEKMNLLMKEKYERINKN
jgi:hypothetical protein